MGCILCVIIHTVTKVKRLALKLLEITRRYRLQQRSMRMRCAGRPRSPREIIPDQSDAEA